MASHTTSATDPHRRWYRPTPDRLIVGLLLLEGLLWVSERFQWFAFNRHKGWTVLIAAAAVAAAFVLMLLWLLASLLRRRRFQFGLRSLLVLVVAVAVPCSWLAVELQRAERQRKAVEAIEGLGDCVAYGYTFHPISGRWPLLREELPGPLWLRRLLGDDFFADVVGMSVHESEVNYAVLEHLRALPRLQEVCLCSCQVSEGGMELVGDLASLRELLLDGSNVDDAGLEHIAGLMQLEHLQVADTHVTDCGLKHLTRLAQLEYLDLSGTQVTDEGVKKLQQALPNCTIARYTRSE